MRLRARSCAVSCFAVVAVGCSSLLSSGVDVASLQVNATPPGRVVALVSVSDRGSARDDLSAENFEVREGKVALDSKQIGLRVQQLGELPGHEAVVLVDGSRQFKDDEREPLAIALAQLVYRLRLQQAVTLMVFDGSPELRFIARYAQSSAPAPNGRDPGIARLLTNRPRDNSSSLYTAIVAGRKALDERLRRVGPVTPIGSLLIVARGPDLAGRTDPTAARAALEGRRSFLLKVGPWSKDTSLDWVGDDGTRVAASLSTLGAPVDALAHDVNEVFLSSYLVSYCSPARAGKRDLEVVVKLRADGGPAREGAATGEFNADGFNPTCLRAAEQASAH